ncbi:MAG TPA: PaaI family thioesterase [Streptosporangiaceae bacterium]|nr:PaaI family thioesterase [Streptosporangiaceae bacterium]
MPEETPTELIRRLMPLCATLGIRAGDCTPGQVQLSLDWAPGLCTSNGILHGGIVMTLADSAAGLCAYLNLPATAQGTATIEGKTNFIAAVRSGTATAVSRPVHVGSRTIVIETDVRTDDGRLAARTIQTQAVLAGPAGS